MTSSNTHAFRPDYVIPPGETLRDRLAEINLSQADLAARTGLSTKHVNQIIQGNAPITLETSLALERVTGMPANFWNRREADYREALLRSKPHALTKEDETWLASLPIGELQKRQRIPQSRDSSQLYDSILSFFGVADRSAWERIWRGPVASFRRSGAYASHPGAVVSWLRIAEIEAQPRKARPYAAAAYRAALDQIRALTASGNPNDLVEICADAGVVVVFVPEVSGCRISGAAWWAAPGRAVIALSDRYKKDDYLWFTFFHESAHILLHSKKETFVDDGSEDDLLEDEANRFAADFLIPPIRAKELPSLTTDEKVRDFAEDLGISPGIVVGRLQHEGLWGWNRGHKLKRGVRIIEE